MNSTSPYLRQCATSDDPGRNDLSVGAKCPILRFPQARTCSLTLTCPRHMSRTRADRSLSLSLSSAAKTAARVVANAAALAAARGCQRASSAADLLSSAQSLMPRTMIVGRASFRCPACATPAAPSRRDASCSAPQPLPRVGHCRVMSDLSGGDRPEVNAGRGLSRVADAPSHRCAPGARRSGARGARVPRCAAGRCHCHPGWSRRGRHRRESPLPRRRGRGAAVAHPRRRRR